MEKEIEEEELYCSDDVANKFLQGFDLLKEYIEEFGKNWTLKMANNIQF